MQTLDPAPSAKHTESIDPHGYVHVEGAYALTHRLEIEALLRREADRAHRDSPASDVIAWDDDGTSGLLVTTTTEHLAHRLRSALHKALGGKLHHRVQQPQQACFGLVAALSSVIPLPAERRAPPKEGALLRPACFAA